jgi:aspartate aminotransferase-like enzyme
VGDREPPLLFVPGPVEITAEARATAARRLPYHRTPAFSALAREVHDRLRLLFATAGDVVTFTASGTGAMEAAVLSLFTSRDRVLVVNGGTFGARWAEICRVLSIPHDEVEVAPGVCVDVDDLEARLARGHHSGLLLTAHETSTGQLSDVGAIGRLASRHGALYVVDAISALGADAFRMDAWGCDAVVASTQKALALPPGMSFLALSPRARERALAAPRRSLYFHAADYLAELPRGQTPYTPAIGLLVALHERLGQILETGVDALVAEHAARAAHFRAAIAGLPLRSLPARPSNALTALETAAEGPRAPDVVARLRDEFGMQVAPNAPPLAERVFRVSHLGAQRIQDLDRLASALAIVTKPEKRSGT